MLKEMSWEHGREYKEEIKIIGIDMEELRRFRNKFAVSEDRDVLKLKVLTGWK